MRAGAGDDFTADGIDLGGRPRLNGRLDLGYCESWAPSYMTAIMLR